MHRDTHRIQDPNRVGNIPMHWYDDMPHIGYDIDGKRVLRPAVGDDLDKFLKTQEDPTAWCAIPRLCGSAPDSGIAGCLL